MNKKFGEFSESGESVGSKKSKSDNSPIQDSLNPESSPDSLDLYNPFPEPVEIEITDSLDLHSFSPRDVRSVVETYLQEARRKGFRRVRIIHGKGIGVQREIVRKILSKSELVKSFKTADEFSGGGWGATIAEFYN